MPIATAWRTASAGNEKGRTVATSSPIILVNRDNHHDNGPDWRAQLLVSRHGVSRQFGNLIAGMIYREALDG